MLKHHGHRYMENTLAIRIMDLLLYRIILLYAATRVRPLINIIIIF